MPTPPRPREPLQAELDRQLIFRQDWVADPAPEIWRIVGQLDVNQQTRFAQTVLASQVTVLEAQLAAKRQIQEGLADIQQ